MHISQWGTYITTPSVSSSSVIVDLKTKIENNLSTAEEAVLKSQIFDNSDNLIAQTETPIHIHKNEKKEFSQEIRVPSPKLWSVHSPNMYTLKSTISLNGKTIDQYETPFGIRSIEFSAQKGFLLNGERIKINGVCLHHDAGCLGAAVPIKVWERRLKILKQMGCNAIRTSHNPMASEFMDLCDKMGFLVMDEPFDEWMEAKGNTTSAYHKYFFKNCESFCFHYCLLFIVCTSIPT
jgi:beta-galactosidase